MGESYLYEDIDPNDIEPAPPKESNRYQIARTPNDGAFMADDPTRSGSFAITLAVVRKIRLAQMARRIENEKRMKQIADVYNVPADDGGGGMPF